MTNSKQYCDVCGVRYSIDHLHCRSSRPPQQYYRMLLEGTTTRVSSVRENEDGTIFELFPEMCRQHANLEAWKKFFDFSFKHTIVEYKR